MSGMTAPDEHDGDWTSSIGLNLGLRSYVADDAEFRAAVEAGIASFETGKSKDGDEVEAELLRRLRAKA
jgi:predicted transcriptional regulator